MNPINFNNKINVKELGYHYFDNWYLAYIPLELISFENGPRYGYNMELTKKTGTTRPIILGDLENGKYILVDGNHRCYCAKELGYTHIPAIVDSSVIDKRLIVLSNEASP